MERVPVRRQSYEVDKKHGTTPRYYVVMMEDNACLEVSSDVKNPCTDLVCFQQLSQAAAAAQH